MQVSHDSGSIRIVRGSKGLGIVNLKRSRALLKFEELPISREIGHDFGGIGRNLITFSLMNLLRTQVYGMIQQAKT